jgi:hypothetical protein
MLEGADATFIDDVPTQGRRLRCGRGRPSAAACSTRRSPAPPALTPRRALDRALHRGVADASANQPDGPMQCLRTPRRRTPHLICRRSVALRAARHQGARVETCAARMASLRSRRSLSDPAGRRARRPYRDSLDRRGRRSGSCTFAWFAWSGPWPSQAGQRPCRLRCFAQRTQRGPVRVGRSVLTASAGSVPRCRRLHARHRPPPLGHRTTGRRPTWVAFVLGYLHPRTHRRSENACSKQG